MFFEDLLGKNKIKIIASEEDDVFIFCAMRERKGYILKRREREVGDRISSTRRCAWCAWCACVNQMAAPFVVVVFCHNFSFFPPFCITIF